MQTLFIAKHITQKVVKSNFLNKNVNKTLSSAASFKNLNVKITTNENDIVRSKTHPKLSYQNSTADGIHMFDETIGSLIDSRSLELGSQPVFLLPHQGININYAELKQRVDAVCQNYLDLGFKKGDRVAFLLPNCYELIISYLAACKVGLISVILNPAYQAVELEYMLNKTSVKGVFFYDSFRILKHMEMFNKLCPELETSLPGELSSKVFPNLKHLFVLNSPLVPEKKTYKGTWEFSKFMQPKSNGNKSEMPYVDIDDPCTILFTVKINCIFIVNILILNVLKFQ